MSSMHIVGTIQIVEALSRDAAAEVETVSAATQEQSAGMDEIANSSNSLSELAQKLQEATTRFKV